MLALELNEIVLAELKILLDEVKHLNSQINVVNELIEAHAPKLHGYENVMSIKGIGTNTAVALLCAIGDVKDFKDIKKLASYVGLAPWVSNSNETVKHGRITKNGSPLVRKMLINCAFVAVKYSPILKGFYSRIKDKKGFGKAIVATARKLLAVVYATLVNGWYFTDFCANKKEIKAINWEMAF